MEFAHPRNLTPRQGIANRRVRRRGNYPQIAVEIQERNMNNSPQTGAGARIGGCSAEWGCGAARYSAGCRGAPDYPAGRLAAAGSGGSIPS